MIEYNHVSYERENSPEIKHVHSSDDDFDAWSIEFG